MINLFYKIFSKSQKKLQNEQNAQTVETKYQNITKPYTPILYFSLVTNNGHVYYYQYNIVQIKQKNAVLKCLAKEDKHYNDLIIDYNPKVEFLKDIIIFPMHKINTDIILYYNGSKNSYSCNVEKNIQNKFSVPDAVINCCIDQYSDIVRSKQYLMSQINEIYCSIKDSLK